MSIPVITTKRFEVSKRLKKNFELKNNATTLNTVNIFILENCKFFFCIDLNLVVSTLFSIVSIIF